MNFAARLDLDDFEDSLRVLVPAGAKNPEYGNSERPAQILHFLLMFHCSDIKIQTKTTETPRQTSVLPNSTGVLLPAASGLPPPTSWSGSLTGVPPAYWALLRGGCWSAAPPLMTCRMSPILIPPIPRRGGRKRLYFFI